MSRLREGVNWDFKKTHHENNALLIHDILCLANAEFDGDRYLIYGIQDGSFEVVGVQEQARRTQADLVSFLRDIAGKFEAHRTPDVKIQSIDLKGKDIDILTIADLPHKPYRLLEKYQHQGKTVYPSIYTRREDVNTPIDRSATSDELEVMFQERFGLNLPPHKRLAFLLAEAERWQTQEANTFFHEQFPEFTYEFKDKSDRLDEEWLRGEIGHYLPDGSWFCEITFHYYSTKIGSVDFASFDNGKKHAIRPDWAPYKGGRVYFYEEDTLRLAMQKHLATRDGTDYSKHIMSPNRRGYFDLPILSSITVRTLWNAEQLDVETDKEAQNRIFETGMHALLIS